MTDSTNVASYLDGLYAPVDDELTVSDLAVTGRLPFALDGMFAQVGPNPVARPTGPYHWFDGDGMVHGVSLREGRATYVNRWVRTDAYRAARSAGRAAPGLLAPFDPASDPAHRDPDTANTSLVHHEGRTYALWWQGGKAWQLAVPSLATVGPDDLEGGLTSGMASQARVDPRTRELFFFDLDPYRQPHLSLGCVGPDHLVRWIRPIPLRGPSLVHDFAITERWVVVMDLPLAWDPLALARGRRKVQFHGSTPIRLGLLDRRDPTAPLRWFDARPGHVYHTVNAWDEPDGEVVLLGCRIADPIPKVTHQDETEVPRLTFMRLEPYLYEWRLNLTSGGVAERRLCGTPGELPRMNDGWIGGPGRHVYLARVAPHPSLLFDGFLKVDVQSGRAETCGWGPDRYGGEVVFVPDARGAGEDDGWLICCVSSRATGTSELVVVDARKVSAGPVGRVRLPRRVPMGFHAAWLPLPST